MSLTPAQLAGFAAAALQNRISLPPVQYAGIGQQPYAMPPSSFGGLQVRGPVAAQVFTATPQLTTFWHRVWPTASTSDVQPAWIAVDTAAKTLFVPYRGLYLVNLLLNATVNAGDAFRFEFRLNGVPTGLAMDQNLSNQSDRYFGGFAGVAHIPDEGTVTLWGTGNGPFTATFCEMQLVRVR